MSLVHLYVHVIFRTKYSVPVIPHEHADNLYRYVWKIISESGSKLLRINGMEDHIHLFIALNPSTSLSDLIRNIKANSSKWMKKQHQFHEFLGWASEYAAFSYSEKEKSTVINYIKNQREHHKRISFQDEVARFYEEFCSTEKLPFFWQD